MRIVLVSGSYPPRVGGLEGAVSRLAAELTRAGHRVTVITNRYPRTLPRYERRDGIEVHRILFPLLWPTAWGGRALLRHGVLLLFAPAAFYRLARLLRRLQPEVVNVHYVAAAGVYVTVLARLRQIRARVVVSCHGSDASGPVYPTGARWLTRWVLRRADSLTACSAYVAARMADIAPIRAAREVHVVYNGADLAVVAGAPHAHPHPYVFFGGRLTQAKGCDVLVRAIARVRAQGIDCHLLIAGSGPYEETLRSLIAQEGLHGAVHLLGNQTAAQMANLYAGCAMFVLPSLREGLGMVLLEAMAQGKPVIGTRVGGIPEVVAEGQAGLLVPPADVEALAAAISTLFSNPTQAADLGKRGQERAQSSFFTWAAVAHRYMQSYTDTQSCPCNRSSRLTLLAPQSKYRVPILMYHQIAWPTPTGVKPSLYVTPRAFAAQMLLLRLLGWRTMRMDALAVTLRTGQELPPRRFVVTFDDAFEGVAHYAVPVLRCLGFTATIFAPTALLGTQTALDGGADHPDKALMSWDTVRALRTKGFEIGAHTRTHPHLSQVSPDELHAQILGAQRDLADQLGVTVAAFAYPYGDWTPDALQAVIAAGFQVACSTRFGRAGLDDNIFALPRLSVGSALDLPHFAYRVLRADAIALRSAMGGAQ